jgi:endonuclease YncB( thermonuclease family)
MRHYLRLLLGVTIFVAANLSVAHSETIVGRATVIDGDTIEIQDERIRLNGVDAPETAQLCRNAQQKPYRCGAVAASANLLQ